MEPRRVVALGASNLTRGLRPVVSLSRQAWGPDTEVLAALGLGRSYGAESRLLIRRLPGILQCGLWQRLRELPPRPTVGVVSDVGNDILYGYPAPQILAWVGEAVSRLQAHTSDIAVTGLPEGTAERLSDLQFKAIRTFMFPSSRRTLAETRVTAAAVHAGLEQMAASRGLRFVRLPHEWYGWDPIHFRYPFWRQAWAQFLGLEASAGQAPPEPGGLAETVRLWLRADEHRWLLGVHQHTPQRGRLQLF